MTLHEPHAQRLPLYVQSPRAFVRKDGERFVIEVEKERAAEARIGEVSQVAVFGNTSLSASALHECFRREIPVTWHTYGGWFVIPWGRAIRHMCLGLIEATPAESRNP